MEEETNSCLRLIQKYRQGIGKEGFLNQQGIGIARECSRLLRVLLCGGIFIKVIRLTSLCLFAYCTWVIRNLTKELTVQKAKLGMCSPRHSASFSWIQALQGMCVPLSFCSARICPLGWHATLVMAWVSLLVLGLNFRKSICLGIYGMFSKEYLYQNYKVTCIWHLLCFLNWFRTFKCLEKMCHLLESQFTGQIVGR